MRGTFRLGILKFGFLDEVPYLFSRLHLPGVRDRCVEQYKRFAAARHHRVSNEFYDAEDPMSLHDDVENLAPDASNMSPRLSAAHKGLLGTPMDDTVAESPHSHAAKGQIHCRGCSWDWLCATVRLSQNLLDVRQLPSVLQVDLQTEWCSYTRILQMGKGRHHADCH